MFLFEMMLIFVSKLWKHFVTSRFRNQMETAFRTCRVWAEIAQKNQTTLSL